MTVASMTGFGRASGALSQRLSVSIIIRSVNHRFLDLQLRTNLREELPEAETTLRTAITRHVKRGRVGVQANFERTTPASTQVLVNSDALQSVLDQLRKVSDNDTSIPTARLGELLTLPGLVLVNSEETLLSEDELQRLKCLGEDAVAQLLEMRHHEGESLQEQIMAELGSVRAFLDWLEPQMPEVRQRLYERISERLQELLGTLTNVDTDRLLTEAALMADRVDVAEETVRLRSHLASFEQRLHAGGAVGRALDFLCQEVNRELNTLGSKCREAGVADRLVDAKTATERVREQVQNLE